MYAAAASARAPSSGEVMEIGNQPVVDSKVYHDHHMEYTPRQPSSGIVTASDIHRIERPVEYTASPLEEAVGVVIDVDADVDHLVYPVLQIDEPYGDNKAQNRINSDALYQQQQQEHQQPQEVSNMDTVMTDINNNTKVEDNTSWRDLLMKRKRMMIIVCLVVVIVVVVVVVVAVVASGSGNPGSSSPTASIYHAAPTPTYSYPAPSSQNYSYPTPSPQNYSYPTPSPQSYSYPTPSPQSYPYPVPTSPTNSTF